MFSEPGLPNQHNSTQRYQELFEMLLEAIPSSILLMDRDLRVVSVNRNFLEKNKKQEFEVIGDRIENVLPQVIVEGMDIVGHIRRVFTTSMPTRGKRMTYRAPGIPIRVYYYSILPFSWKGKVENVIFLMEDVTEQVRLSGEVRRVERHLASVVESARDIVLSADSEGRVLTWNSSAERLTGFTLDDVRQTPFFDRCASDSRENLRQVFNLLLLEETSQTGEFDLITKAGRRIPISWVFSPMKDHSTKEFGIVAVGRDLSEHRKLEQQLLQSQKLAALGVMAGGIAHEIRNPLAICSSAAQFLLEEQMTSEFGKECVAKILAGIQRASTIIENLLRFARPAPTSEMKELDLGPVIRDAVELVSNQAKIQKISVQLVLPDQPLPVHGNHDLLRQVILNLCLNAINALPDGGDLIIQVNRMDAQVSIRVEDTGRGIPRDKVEHVFDPFFTMSPVGKGTGLGLSICYSIVKQHFGSIEVGSQEGKGTVFDVRLPVLR